MDVSDAMENIKDLIWNEVSHSPASHLLQQTRPVELTLFTQRQKKSSHLNHLTMARTIFTTRNTILPARGISRDHITVSQWLFVDIVIIRHL